MERNRMFGMKNKKCQVNLSQRYFNSLVEEQPI
jgi:hypothetical protein